MLATLEVRRKVWALHHGMMCFSMAQEVYRKVQLPNVKTGEAGDVSTLYGQLLKIYALYGRPFKQQLDWCKLNPVLIVPPNYMILHYRMLRFRDRVFAHIDTGARQVKADDGTALVHMVVGKSGNEFRPTMSFGCPGPEDFREMGELLIAVDLKCRSELSSLLAPYDPHLLLLPDGLFLVDVDTPDEAEILVAY